MPVDLFQVPTHDPLGIIIVTDKRDPNIDDNDEKNLQRDKPENPVPLPLGSMVVVAKG